MSIPSQSRAASPLGPEPHTVPSPSRNQKDYSKTKSDANGTDCFTEFLRRANKWNIQVEEDGWQYVRKGNVQRDISVENAQRDMVGWDFVSNEYSENTK